MEENTHYTPPDYLIDTFTDEAGIRATIRTMLPPVRYRLNLAFGILLILISPSMLLMKEYLLGICAIVTAVCCLVFYRQLPQVAAERQIARLRESYGTTSIPCQIVFWPQGVVINNRQSGGNIMIRYEFIRAISRCGDYLTFRTQENQSVIIRMQDLADQPEFLPYFLGKCPNAKKKNL